jgi:molybdate transport system substrate-binding protein
MNAKALLAFTMFLFSTAGAPACAGAPTVIHVFAAASLTEAFTEMGAAFEAAHPGVTVVFNFAGSAQLAQQIVEGAPADVFASANQAQMDAAAGKRAAPAAPIFAANRLVVIFPAGNPGGIATLVDLAKPGLRVTLAAVEIPAGQYALEFLDKAGRDAAFPPTFAADVLANVVSYEQNVRSVLAKVALGEADAGIVYASDVTGQVGRLDIPGSLNVIARYSIAWFADSPKADLAAEFVAYVLSDEGQAALAKYNFTLVGDAE